MLTLSFAENEEIEVKIFGSILNGGQRVLLNLDDVPVGIACFRLQDDKVVIERIGVLEEFRRRRFGDFFTRSLIFKFSLSKLDIVINGQYAYFEKFGFNNCDNNKMIAVGGEVTFPSSCSSCNH